MDDVVITDGKPRDSLSPLILRYSHVRVDRDPGFRLHVVCDAASHALFPLGGPLEFQSDAGVGRIDAPTLIGPHETPFRIKAWRGNEYMLAGFARFSLPGLFGIPASRYANACVALREAVPGSLADVPALAAERMGAAAGKPPGPGQVELAFAMLDQALADLAERSGKNNPGKLARERAIAALLWDGDPALSVAELAALHGWTRRSMVEASLAAGGFTPKVLRRIARAAALRERVLEAADGLDLASLALDCGYADQAHAVRDLSHYAGFPPATLKRKFPGFREGWLRTRTP